MKTQKPKLKPNNSKEFLAFKAQCEFRNAFGNTCCQKNNMLKGNRTLPCIKSACPYFVRRPQA
jgi:hypothetical protein